MSKSGNRVAALGGLSGLVLFMSLALPIITHNRTTWEEALVGIVPSAAVLVVALLLAGVGLIMKASHR